MMRLSWRGARLCPGWSENSLRGIRKGNDWPFTIGRGPGRAEHSSRGCRSLNVPTAWQGSAPKPNKDWPGLRALPSQTSEVESDPNTSIRVQVHALTYEIKLECMALCGDHKLGSSTLTILYFWCDRWPQLPNRTGRISAPSVSKQLLFLSHGKCRHQQK